MWEKSKRVLVSSVLSLSLIGNTTVLAAVNNPTQIQENENIARNYLKVSYESKILFHEQVPSKTMIQVLNEDNEVIESTVLTSDKEMNLEKPKVSNGKMLSYWTIEMKDGKLLIKPVLTTKEEFSVKFYVQDVGGSLLENHKQIKEVVKSATKDAKLKDVLPDVNPDKNYKFTGWFSMVDKGDGKKVEEKLENVEDIKITDSKGEYYAKFFSDFNNNGIDDKTEEITVNFVTNVEEQIEPVKINVGQKIKAPKLSNKDKIFIGWYTNSELTNKFANDNLKESITLYAKWENAEKVITESEKKPITDKDVSDQVEKILNERFKDLKENQTATEKPNETTNEVTNKETNEVTEKPKENNNDNKGAATNNNQKSETNSTKDNVKPNSSNATPSTSSPAGGLTQKDTKLKDNVILNGSNTLNGNKVSTYTETKYVFKNKNVGEKYMVKFLDESGAFVSSLTLPYGRTIKILDENENAHEEYAVRQDTTIHVDTEKYVNKGSTFLGLDTRTVQVNSTEITEIYPTTGKNNTSNSFLYKKDKEIEQKKDSGVQNTIIILVTVAVICIVLGIFVFLKKRKKKEKNQEQNINM
ncbi:InlB B-repeat-containing protein [Bacillus cereus]|nr:InlB B-repeat-containing protein [Bacillus cereus]